MTAEEITEVEKQVYAWIIENHEAKPDEMSREEAEKLGALAFFGEKYGEEVRVLQIKDKNTGELISAELCGGTHLDRTGDIGMLIITSETGVAAGIRRIEALVGERAFAEVAHLREIIAETAQVLGADPKKLAKRAEELESELSRETKAREQLAQRYANSLVDGILERAKKIGDVEFVTARIEGVAREDLRVLADSLKSRKEKICGFLASVDKKNRLAVLCFASKPASKDYPAGEILKAVAGKLKGGGGGSATLAEGSVAETSLDKLTSIFLDVVKSLREEK
jgi:alanyl-tRNA synthetase